MSKAQLLLRKVRGAQMVEYAILIVAVMGVCVGMYRLLGKQLNDNAAATGQELLKTGSQ